MASKVPEVKEGLGEKENFKKLKLHLKSHKNPRFESDTNKFTIVLKRDKEEVKLLAKLEEIDAGGKETEVKNSVFVQVEDDDLTFDVAVKKTGWYKFNIFAAPKTQESMSLPGVYTYLFYVSKIKEKVCPYPKQFMDWKDGCKLYEPHHLDESCDLDKDIEFKLKVPDAQKVAVIAGGAWTHLEKDDDKWKGEVPLKSYFQEADNVTISVSANFPGDDDTQFRTLLQFNTKPDAQ